MSDRVLGSDAARAVGRFRAEGPLGYRAKSVPDAPLRPTRPEAVSDEAAWWERPLRARPMASVPMSNTGGLP